MILSTIIFIISILTVSCEKKDPNPELRDLIYQDMLSQRGEAERVGKETEAKISDIKKLVLEARPNTGIRQKLEKQIFELKKIADKMEQQKVYWKLRTFKRLEYVRLKASLGKAQYKSDTIEWEQYNAEKRLRMAKNAWDLKSRFKDAGVNYDPVLMGENPADVPKKAAAPPQGEGHH